jgi:AcrR family transcriptional regulator
LERAALELFVEQGFAETTVPQITARAGLTTRTFFRHFADKREVLFAYQAELPTVVARVLADTPASLGPMDAIMQGLQTVAAEIESQRTYLRTRHGIVETDDGLRERELRKQSVLSDAIRRELLKRGIDELTATLAAEIAVSVFGVAVTRWLDNDEQRSLSQVVNETFTALLTLAAYPTSRV